MKKLFITTMLISCGFVAQAQITKSYCMERNITGKNIEIAKTAYKDLATRYPTYTDAGVNELFSKANYYIVKAGNTRDTEMANYYHAIIAAYQKRIHDLQNMRDGIEPLDID